MFISVFTNLRKFYLPVLFILAFQSVDAQQKVIPLYKNPKAPVQQRVSDLLKRMTVEEKVSQLLSHYDADASDFNERLDTTKKALAMIKHGFGIFQPFDVTPERDVAIKNTIQKYFLEKTRLGIPVLFTDEGLHGAMRPNAVSFPQAIAMASSWDTSLVRKVNNVTGTELRARGSQIVLSPVVDIARDPRWGRVEETFGEDTHLSAMMGIAAVKGLQGSANGTVDKNHVAASLKHFAGHGHSEGGLNQAPVEISERAFRNFHLRPFQLIIRDAKPLAIMPSYNTIDGIPSHANTWLLRDVLKKEWNFNGLVVSDWGAIGQLFGKHAVAANVKEAAALALKAGVDLDQSSGAVYIHLKEMAKTNPTLLPLINEAVARVLTMKFKLGLFEDPYISIENINKVINTPASKQLAFEAAAKSMVLLKNKNNILPFAVDKYKRIAVVGPHADNMMLGAYSGIPLKKETVYQSLKNKFSSAEVIYAKGCHITKNYPENSLQAWKLDLQDTATTLENNDLIKEAEKEMRRSDVIVLVLGEDEHITREHWSSKIERGGDQATLNITQAQEDLFEAAVKTGKPVVVYLINGRPLSINSIQEKADAIIEGWYAGQEGPNALAAVLTGEVNPSGKLPITFPK
ncbi:MAG: glycoside hydrolase family 3 C-terminal domain-containing protein, partial [Pyrinomonadaceae bacterium]|nr:glycoside hydrolase family 3 C-terminal domain-containing protein [Sphingobacteriaceae bacterium]